MALALIAAMLAGSTAGPRSAVPAGMVVIPAGTYAPRFGAVTAAEPVKVRPFLLDARPVTNAEFLAFVAANPAWRRSQVNPRQAEEGYLADWAGDQELGARAPANAPVVRVSWFAARAYAQWRGRRLPTTAEWERAAAIGFATEDGRSEPAYREAALDWFAQPTPSPLPAAGLGRPNRHGARDLLTLVWEWVDDFDTATDPGATRGAARFDPSLFCGAGAADTRALADYPEFMRTGFRSSLRANYAVPSLGFRCAQDLPVDPR